MFGSKSEDGFIEVIEGIRIKTIVYGKETLMSEFRMRKESILPEHTHAHEQIGYLVQGKIRLTIDGNARVLSPGESWCVPSNALHRAQILEDSIAIEVFSPLREEYLQYANKEDLHP